jgi:hypothetical protein
LNTKKTLIVCNDAGAAQNISSYLYFNKIGYFLSISRIAKKIFKDKNVYKNNINFSEGLKISSFYITGTSWTSKKEIILIKNYKEKVVTILDHWVNIKKRFLLKKKYYFPREVWTFDKYSYQAAKEQLPGIVNVKKIKNYNLMYARIIENKVKKNNDYYNNYLYLTEPIKKFNKLYLKKKSKYTEIDAFSFFLNKLYFFNRVNKVTIRVHPKDNKNQYLKLVKNFKNFKIFFSNNSNVFKDLASNYNVVSCNSSILALASDLKKKKVYCSIPVKSENCLLPHKNIKYLRDL